MPTAITHSFVAVALGTALRRRIRPIGFWLLGAACAAAPDLDVVGLRLGVPYGAAFGHRGATHSLVFAALLAAALAVAARARSWTPGVHGARLFAFLFLATASHGVLDAFTNGGRGIAFLWPFEATRHFAPFRPLEVSPLSVRRFVGPRGLEVLASELLWVWIPCALLVGAPHLRRRQRTS